ncbi:MAG: hypothetical protein QOJ00_1977 [Actinomycetota bacterium]|jgi:hypothetical protein
MRDHRERDDYRLAEAHRRFGGMDLPAALAGLLAAVGLTVLLAGIASAAGSYGYQRGTDTTNLSIGGLAAGLAVLLVSFLIGGWVAGRMARYDGVRNGVMTAVLFVLLAGGLSALGAWAGDKYNFFARVNLPDWFTHIDRGSAIAGAAIGVVVMLLAGALGGAWGGRYHRRADAVIAADGYDGDRSENDRYTSRYDNVDDNRRDDVGRDEIVRSDDADAQLTSSESTRRRSRR